MDKTFNRQRHYALIFNAAADNGAAGQLLWAERWCRIRGGRDETIDVHAIAVCLCNSSSCRDDCRPVTDRETRLIVDARSATQECVTKAAVGNRFEIQSSNMVSRKSLGNELNLYAQKIIDDHINVESRSNANHLALTEIAGALCI